MTSRIAFSRWPLGVFVLSLAFHLWGVQVGWRSKNLPGVEYRQAQTALSTYWIAQEGNYSLAYPTPVLGKPWSVPMEFPLFQWTVAALSRCTGWELLKAGRLVSAACFYLTLPGIFLLLARWDVDVRRRWLVMAVMLTCPFYIFYARAFLMETMALMFSVWFWLAFERAVAKRHGGWLVLAMVAGMGAGVVKVTTFMVYLLPAGFWAVGHLWTRRKTDWKTELAWMAGAVALPFAATLAWLHFADATKALNPLADFLLSGNLRDFNWGTEATRFSPEMWAMKGRTLRDSLTWLPAVGVGVLAAGLAGGRRWRGAAVCLGLFLAPLAIFPVLYALHEYYFVANTLLLLLAMGLGLTALADARRPAWLAMLAVGFVTVGQAARYLDHYYPVQKQISHGGNGLSLSLQAVTRPDEYLVVTGQDWSSITPFYAQRRALMLRADTENNADRVRVALQAMSEEKLGALVITGPWENRRWLVEACVALGLEPTPLYLWRDVAVFLPANRRRESLAKLEEHVFPEVRYAPGVELPPELTASNEKLDGRWYRLDELRPSQRRLFRYMAPMPVRFFSQFGPGLKYGEVPEFGAHPRTRLVFALQAGRHVLKTSVRLPPAAYDAQLSHEELSDGIEVSLEWTEADGSRRVLQRRLVNPRDNPADRGWVPLEWEFDLAKAGEVELRVGPGPTENLTRDWAAIGPVTIE